MKLFALVDCNNFFVSCERVFRPDLEDKPVVVLSSNDGCVVARSNQAKALGIKMGAPAFQLQQLFNQEAVIQFSANFELYGNISRRITELLRGIAPRIEVYSVDESFIDLSSLSSTDYQQWGTVLRARILREIGVPVSIGIAPTKTLAKLAADIAKRQESYEGVCMFPDAIPEPVLATVPICDVWGVGRKLTPKLQAEGIGSALALSKLRPQRAQQLMGIHGRQVVSELNGVSCFPLESNRAATQSIMRSRTFGEDTDETYVIESSIATLAAQAAFALRQGSLLAKQIGLLLTTNRHKPGYRRWYREVILSTPTNDTGLIISRLVNELESIYTGQQTYHRLGIFLHDLVDERNFQTDLLGIRDIVEHDRTRSRMRAIDQINSVHGKGNIRYAAEDLSKRWRPKQQMRSPHYVSDWNELPIAQIYERPKTGV
ncbi:MAG TPA: Y-family DNA polymerase [Candidatus Saccharimonadales bacterium]|nr:Y-family DNA polymerase [Candidatus Saccharimonadales bacterium]